MIGDSGVELLSVVQVNYPHIKQVLIAGAPDPSIIEVEKTALLKLDFTIHGIMKH